MRLLNLSTHPLAQSSHLPEYTPFSGTHAQDSSTRKSTPPDPIRRPRRLGLLRGSSALLRRIGLFRRLRRRVRFGGGGRWGLWFGLGGGILLLIGGCLVGDVAFPGKEGEGVF